jgi:hypothetical protein
MNQLNDLTKLFKVTGPSIVKDEDGVSYWLDNLLHRLDGPAIDYKNGNNWYYIRGYELNKEEFYNHPEVIATIRSKRIKQILK